jgi:formate hydrogenlyase subunit 4
MRRRNVAVVLATIAVLAFAFFVPVVYDPPFQELFKPSGGAYLVSITYFLTGYGATYYYNTYQVYL